jgi:hypothetical protein
VRPDLVPGALTAIVAAQPGLAVYTLVVRNAGRTPASPFAVRVADGHALAAALADGDQRGIVVVAAACAPGSTVPVRVDENGAVDESDERGNTTRLRCPLAGR